MVAMDEISGKDVLATLVVTAYCPVKSSNAAACYAQQLQGLTLYEILGCPRRQFWMDLKKFLKEALDDCDQIVAMGGWNSRKQEVDKWFEDLHMMEAIRELHNGESPVRYKRSAKEYIDCIYTTSTIVGVQGTYLWFHKLGRSKILGFHIHHLVPPKARKLQLDNPAIVDKYNQELLKIIRKRTSTRSSSQSTTNANTLCDHRTNADLKDLMPKLWTPSTKLSRNATMSLQGLCNGHHRSRKHMTSLTFGL